MQNWFGRAPGKPPAERGAFDQGWRSRLAYRSAPEQRKKQNDWQRNA